MNFKSSVINLVIMEESPLTRLGIERFVLSLYQEIRFNIQFASVNELLQLVQNQSINVVISGLAGSQQNAPQKADILIKLSLYRPEIQQIIYTHSRCGKLLYSLYYQPQVSLISRQETQEQAQECFAQALAGFRVCSPKIQAAIGEYAKEDNVVWQRLTRREHEVLRMLFDGLSIAEAANRLKRNIKTISAHKRNAMQKLGVYDDVELFALRMHFSGAEKTSTAGLWQ
jgi:two-component system capsular synthesis response regulator RcsB